MNEIRIPDPAITDVAMTISHHFTGSKKENTSIKTYRYIGVIDRILDPFYLE